MEPHRRDGRTDLGAIAAAYALLFAMGLVDNARGPAFPDILEHFRLTSTAGSLMFAAASIGSVVVSWTGRRWLVRFGAGAAARFFAGLLAVASLGLGAVGFTRLGLPGLIGASLLLGLGATGCSVAANALVLDGSAPGRERRLLSGLHATYGASSLLAPLAIGFGARLGLDWRLAFFWLALIPLAAGAIAFAARSGPRPRAAAPAAPGIPSGTGSRAVAACAMLAACVAAEISLSTRLPLLVERHFRGGAETAALYLSGFFALLLAGRLAFALVGFPGSSARWLAASAVVSLAAYLFGLFVHPLGLVLCGLTLSIFFPVTIAWLRESFGANGERMVASAIAAVGVGLVVMHFGVGALTDVVGIRNALLVGPACLAGALVLLRVALSR
jgi:fucose permease